MALIPTTPVERPSPERLARLRAIAEAYDIWASGAIPAAPFEPEGHPKNSVYNQHYPDVESSGATEDRLVGLVKEAEERIAQEVL